MKTDKNETKTTSDLHHEKSLFVSNVLFCEKNVYLCMTAVNQS